MKDITFAGFLEVINKDEVALANSINDFLITNACKSEVKEAASGFTVSYIFAGTKKVVACFVRRKNGLRIRITPPKPFVCDDIINDFPGNMRNDLVRGNECKRLSGADVCNPRCLMGYTFKLNDITYDKCRSMAFLFDVTVENLPHILKVFESALNLAD